MNEVYSTGQVAKMLRVTPHTVWDWIKRGFLEALATDGGHFRVPREAIEMIVPGVTARDAEDLLTTSEAAQVFGMSRRSLSRRAERRTVRAYRMPGEKCHYRFRLSEVMEDLANCVPEPEMRRY